MLIARTVAELRQHLSAYKKPAFVPTMGNLHEGHLSLMRMAKAQGDISVASIFVNRLQFLPGEDFASYPRTFDSDCDKLRSVGCDLLFAPDETELYPQVQSFKLLPDPALADILEGQFRPGFFTGVCTVVLKLFHCVFAHSGGVAVFGQKDFQQLLILRRMMSQLAMPIDIVTGATTRAPDGLALSSRNGYLSTEERAEAVQLSVALNQLAQAVRAAAGSGGFDVAAAEAAAMSGLRERGWQPDYITLRHQHDLSPVTAVGSEPMVVLGAARLGKTRLIDNFEV
ncbi:MAG: pantoate--beta-alanine ligase [Burkholderiales bacterium]|nr:pantoate--beta-alanine ligase [Burkholderiales bacterium]